MTANDIANGPAPARGRTLNITLWIVQVLLAAFFLVAAAGPKLLGEQYAVEIFTEIGGKQH